MKNLGIHSIILFVMLLFLASTLGAQPLSQVFEEWATSEGTQNFFVKAAVKADRSGNVWVAGATVNASGNYDLLVASYNPEGHLVWIDQYDGAGNGDDAAAALYVDGSGNVFVTGTTFTSTADTADVITIGYDNTGTRLWTDVYTGASGLADMGTAITSYSGKIFVGGISTDATDGIDYLALRYQADGTLDWSNTFDYDGSSDVCTGISIASGDGVLVGATQTAPLDWDFLVTKFNLGSGAKTSEATFSGGSVGFDRVRAVDRDGSGNIFLTGTVANGGTGYDVRTVKLDDTLAVVWSQTYSSSGAYHDEGTAITYDNSGNVYVGGYKTSASQGTDFLTVAYNGHTGSVLWSQIWNDTADGGDTIKALVVDGDHNVTVTGSAWNGSSLDYHTIQND